MNILIASSVHRGAIDELRKEHDVVCAFDAGEAELQNRVADREVLIFRSGVKITADVMGRAPNLRFLVRAGSGIDNIDMEYVRDHGLVLHRIPEPGARAVAEMSFGMMLGLARKICQADGLLRQGTWAKSEMSGYLLRGKILGIVGAGNIGSEVGRMGALWGMEVLGCCTSLLPACRSERLAEMGIRLTGFEEVVSSADFLSIHVPLTEGTAGMFDAGVFSRMKKGAFLVNFARGGVVKEDDLHDALTAGGGLAGAAMDVHEKEGAGALSPLAALSNVILTPHIGAQTLDTQREIGERIVGFIRECGTNPSGSP